MRRALSVLVFLFMASLCLSATLTVAQDGSQQYTVIQEAIDASADGDTVLVWPGRWFENVAFNGHNITLASLEATTGDPQYIHSTIIDGNQQGSCILATDDVSDVAIRGFTLTNGSGTPYYDGTVTVGGGLYAYCSEIKVTNCQVKRNSATSGGGATLGNCDSVFLSGVSVHGNQAYQGGIVFNDEVGTITFDPDNRCSIYNNWGSTPDIFCTNIWECNVIVDTFTVAEPQYYFANYSNWRWQYENHDPYSFDILHGYLEPVNHDLYVAPWGDDDNDGLTEATPLKTIALALHRIAIDQEEPKTVHLTEGTYNLNTEEGFRIVSMKQYVNLVGAGQFDTIIDANGGRQTIAMMSNNGNNTLSDLCVQGVSTISNESSFSMYSSETVIIRNIVSRNNITDGISGHFFNHGENVLYDNVHIIDNTSTDWYGGMEFEGKDVTFDGCVFEGNQSGRDGTAVVALNCDYIQGDLVVRNCTFRNNTGLDSPQALSYIAVFDFNPEYTAESSMIIENNLFEGNIIGQGSTVLVQCFDGEATVSGNTFTNNRNASALRTNGNVKVYNNIFWDNWPSDSEEINVWGYPGCNYTVDVDYNLIEEGLDGIDLSDEVNFLWGEHNIDADPLFEEVYGWPFMPSFSSPCIDAGQPESDTLYGQWDITGNERVWDGDGDGVARMDIGCYERQAFASSGDLIAGVEGDDVYLNWSHPARNLVGWNIYRDSVLIATAPVGSGPLYIDENVPAGVHGYYVAALYGYIETDPTNEVTVNVVRVSEDTPAPLFALSCFPNPFNPSTTIRYSVPQTGEVSITVYNVRGQKVATLQNGQQSAGEHELTWNAGDQPSGVYLLRLQAAGQSKTSKVLLLK